MRLMATFLVLVMALAAAMVIGTEARSGTPLSAAQLETSETGSQLLLLVKNKNKKKKDGDDSGIIKSTCKICAGRLRFCVIQFKCEPPTTRVCKPQPNGDQLCCCARP